MVHKHHGADDKIDQTNSNKNKKVNIVKYVYKKCLIIYFYIIFNII